MSKSKYQGTAELSDDLLYRWQLTREGLIPGNERPLVDIGINPSTADATEDDNTIKKGIHYAVAWGCGRLIKVNAYAYRTKSPKIMFEAKRAGVDIVGHWNGAAIRRNLEIARDAGGIVLVSWGANIEPFRQEQLVEELAGFELFCVARNTDKWGTPKHHLYEKNSALPIPWTYQRPR